MALLRIHINFIQYTYDILTYGNRTEYSIKDKEITGLNSCGHEGNCVLG